MHMILIIYIFLFPRFTENIFKHFTIEASDEENWKCTTKTQHCDCFLWLTSYLHLSKVKFGQK